MKYEEVLRMQKNLDEESVECPECGKESRWWEVRTFSTCMNCYMIYEESQKKDIEL